MTQESEGAAWECERCGRRNPPGVQRCLVCNRRPSDEIMHAHDCPGSVEYPCLACSIEASRSLI